MKTTKKRNTGCPVAFALDIFGDRWSLVILRDILIKGYSTYGEFLGGDESISTNILADRLQDFVRDGLVTKLPDPENGRKKIYLPTEKAIELIPVIVEFIRWSGTYDTNTDVSDKLVEQIKIDRQNFVGKLQERARERAWKLSKFVCS